MYDERIKQLINSRISMLENKLHSIIDTYQENKIRLEKIIKDLKEIKEDYTKIKTFDIKRLNKNEPINEPILDSSPSIANLSFFSLALNQGWILEKSDIKKLNFFVLEFIQVFEKELVELETNYKNNQNSNEINNLKNLLIKLNNYNLEETDFDLLKEILCDNTNLRESVEIMKYVIHKTLKNALINDDSILQETGLDNASLKELLSKYDIDFEELRPISKEELLKYGSLTNISNILSLLKENNLFNKNIYNRYQLPITRILIYSNKELVESIIKSYQKANININSFLDEFYKRPAKFIKRKRRWYGKNNKTGNKKEKTSNEDEIGSYEDFTSNMDLFTRIGIDINEAYKKSSTLFEKAHNHILIGYNNLNLYGITPNYYANTLTVFNTHKQLETIDMFIELDAYNYVLNNMSRVNYTPTSLIFHKLYRLKKQGIPVATLYRNKKGSIVLPIQITDEKLSYDGLNKDNMLTENGIFKPDSATFKVYDEIINQNDNNFIQEGISDIIQKLDDAYLVESEGILENKLYNIEGTIISRLKVLRYLTTLIFNGISENSDMLLYAITKNSLLTKEEFDKIKTSVDKLLNEKVR